MTLGFRQEVEKTVFTDSGLFRQWQFKHGGTTESMFLNATVEDLENNWDAEARVRQGFGVVGKKVKIPTLFYEVDGVHSDDNDYCAFVGKFVSGKDTLLISGKPEELLDITISEDDVLKISFCQRGDGSFDRDMLKALPFYRYAPYNDDTEDFILDKINETLSDSTLFSRPILEKRELRLFSKSMDKGRFVDMLREAWDRLKPETRYLLERIMVERHVSAVFEVIHPNDRHIVDYKDEIRLYLLNFVENDLSTKVYTPEELLGEEGLAVILSDSGICLPRVLGIAHGRDEWRRAVTELSLRKDIEGAVSVDKRGYMVKVKTNWYRDLKASRKALWYGRDINAFTHYAIKHGLGKESVVVIKRQMDKEGK